MDKRAKFGLYAIGVVVLLLVIVEIAKPKPVIWDDSYTSFDKIPLGCYILHEELNNVAGKMIFSNKNIIDSQDILNVKKPSTLVIINSRVYIDESETQELMEFANKGNSVFISATDILGFLGDTLNFKTRNFYRSMIKYPLVSGFYNKNLKNAETKMKEVYENSFFEEIDTLHTVTLGYNYLADNDSIEKVNFIKIPFGNKNGAFYLHTNPYVFTNYHMLKGTKSYAESSLAYVLDKDTIIWDEYYKAGRREVSSPFRFILNEGALKWVFYIILICLVLYVIFRGKRTQRIIPVIEPLKNHTVEFTETIGSLYYQHRDYTNIISKKIVYFLEYVRTHFYLDTTDLNPKFIQNLALKSGKSTEETEDIIKYILYLNNIPVHSEQDLIDLNTKIELFIKK